MASVQHVEWTEAAAQDASERALRIIFPKDAIVWVVAEAYEQVGPVWRVDLVCQAAQGRWMRRRYRFDLPSGTLNFAGEFPATPADLADARAAGRRL